MNLYLTRLTKIVLSLLSVFVSIIGNAQVKDSLGDTVLVKDYVAKNRAIRNTSFNVIPSYYVFQYAGSIGLVSLGAGWDYGKKNQWSTDFLIGYVPKYDTDRAKIALTLRQTYSPWQISVKENVTYDPLRTGVYFNTTIGKQFWFSAPEKYPNKYYHFSTKLRLNIFIGQSFSYSFASKTSYFEKIKVYYDLHTSDLFLISRFQNNYLRAQDFLGLSLGVKLQIRQY